VCLQEQYIFVYDALLEALKAGKTVISCSVFRAEFDQLSVVDAASGKSKLQQQYEASFVFIAFFTSLFNCLHLRFPHFGEILPVSVCCCAVTAVT